jgi:hypothetical protein
MQTEAIAAHAVKISDLLTPDQLTLMVNLLSRICASGYGELSIVIMEGKIRFFRATFSIPAPPKVSHE